MDHVAEGKRLHTIFIDQGITAMFIAFFDGNWEDKFVLWLLPRFVTIIAKIEHSRQLRLARPGMGNGGGGC